MRGVSKRECEARVLFHLESPEETSLADASLDTLVEVLGLCQISMVRVFEDVRDSVLSTDATDVTTPGKMEVPLWSGALCAAAIYYDYVVSRVLSEEPLGSPLELVKEDNVSLMLDMSEAFDSKHVSAAAYFVARYLQMYLALGYFRDHASDPFIGAPWISLLVYVYSPLGDLARFVRTKGAYPLGGFAIHSVISALANTSAVCKAVSEESMKTLERMASASKGVDLADLASRAQHAVERFGDKNVGMVFERQLAFLMQSFGFFVSPASRGRRAIDLICISAVPKPYTLMLEAKTSRRAYYLPAKDARALKEYAINTQAVLSTLPPLKLLLLVGPNPASTLANKLRSLEAEVGVPIRYCEASVLADLRKRLPGPAPAHLFLKGLQLSDHVANGGFADAVARGYERQQATHDRFVQEMLAEGSALDRLLG